MLTSNSLSRSTSVLVPFGVCFCHHRLFTTVTQALRRMHSPIHEPLNKQHLRRSCKVPQIPLDGLTANPDLRDRHTATRHPFTRSHQKAKLEQQSPEKETGIDCMMMTRVVDISFKKRPSMSIHGAPHRRPTITGARAVLFSDRA